MRYIALCLLLLAGCYPGPSVPPEPEPTADTIEQAAFDACKAHAVGLAKVATDTADKAATFKSHADAADFGAAANKAARDESFAAFYKAVDAQLDPEHSEYDGEKTAKVFRSAAKGFERAGK